MRNIFRDDPYDCLWDYYVFALPYAVIFLVGLMLGPGCSETPIISPPPESLIDVPAPSVSYLDLVHDGHRLPGALIVVDMRGHPGRCRLTITDRDGNTSIGYDPLVVASKFLFPSGKNAAWIERHLPPDWIKQVQIEVVAALPGPKPIPVQPVEDK